MDGLIENVGNASVDPRRSRRGEQSGYKEILNKWQDSFA